MSKSRCRVESSMAIQETFRGNQKLDTIDACRIQSVQEDSEVLCKRPLHRHMLKKAGF